MMALCTSDAGPVVRFCFLDFRSGGWVFPASIDSEETGMLLSPGDVMCFASLFPSSRKTYIPA